MPEHSLVTEAMIVITQTAFFVILFVAMKTALVDRRRTSYRNMKEDWLLHAAAYFAMFVLIIIFMTPLHSYAFVHYIVPMVLVICAGIVSRDVYIAVKRKDLHIPVSSEPEPVKEKVKVSAKDNDFNYY